MRYSQLVPPPKLLVRRATVDAMVEHAGLVDRMIAAGWLKPRTEGGRVDLFAVKEVEKAVERYLSEGLPARESLNG
jgi:hypothetical protein